MSSSRFYFYCTGLLILASLLTHHVQSQKIINSPYSSFGMGEIDYSSMGFNKSMGGTGVAMSDSNKINLLNQANLSFLGAKRPIFNVGFKGTFTTLQSDSKEEMNNSIIFQNLSLGIPIHNNWGLAVGLTPFSKVGYDITSYDASTIEDTIRYNYDGNGGSNRVFLSLSYRPINTKKHQLAIGLTGAYLFGSAERKREAIYPGDDKYFNSRYIEGLRFTDFIFDASFLYKYRWDEQYALSVGANYTPEMEVKAFNDVFSYSYEDRNGQEVRYDTIQLTDTLQGNIRLPRRLSAGVSFEFKSDPKQRVVSRTTVNLDFTFQEWSRYNEDFSSTAEYENTFRNSMIYALGVQFVPNDGSKYAADASYFSKISYRAGGRYQSTKLTLNNTNINNFGISFGFGFPLNINGAVSSLNIGAEWGQQGTTNNGLLKEDFWEISLGVTLSPGRYDRWFVKRKYK